MNTISVAIGVCITDDHALDLEAFAAACGAEVEFVRLLVDEGLLLPAAVQPAWRFGGEELARVRRIRPIFPRISGSRSADDAEQHDKK